MEHLQINDSKHFDALLADEVVMNWLMELEADQCESAEIDQEPLRQA